MTRSEVADGADQRGLAGAVGAEQAEEGAGGDLEVEVLDAERAVVVALGQGAQLEGGGVAEHRVSRLSTPAASADSNQVVHRLLAIVLAGRCWSLRCGAPRARPARPRFAKPPATSARPAAPTSATGPATSDSRAPRELTLCLLNEERAKRGVPAAALRAAPPGRGPALRRARWWPGSSSNTTRPTANVGPRRTASGRRAIPPKDSSTRREPGLGHGLAAVSPVEIVDGWMHSPRTPREHPERWPSPRSGSASCSTCRRSTERTLRPGATYATSFAARRSRLVR